MRRFEMKEGSSSKFWEIALEGKTFTVRFGKIGTDGRAHVKAFASTEVARAEHDALVAEKLAKGYGETSSSPEGATKGTLPESGIATSLLALFDSLTSRAPQVAVWTGKLTFPKGGVSKWRETKVAWRNETVGAYLDRVAATVGRGDRWLDVRIEGDVVLVAAWDWRDDRALFDTLDLALEAAAPLKPKGSVTQLSRAHDTSARRRTSTFRGKKLVRDDNEDDVMTPWDEDADVKSALATIAPAFQAWLAAHPATAARIERSKCHGYVDRRGREVIPPRFSSASAFSEGLAVVYEGVVARLMGVDGTLVPGGWQAAGAFLRGRAPVAVGDTDHWGYVDRTGALVIEAKFAFAEPFHGSLAMVRHAARGTGRWITKEGELVGDPFGWFAHDPKCRFAEGRAWTFPHIDELTQGKGIGCVDEQGRAALGRRFYNVMSFSEGVAAVVELGATLWGYIDTEGNVVIEPRFDEAHPFSEGRAVVRVGKQHRLIDRTGAFVGGPFVSSGLCRNLVSGGMLPFAGGGKLGFLTRDGEIAIAPQFDQAVGFFEERAIVAMNSADGRKTHFGHIDLRGEYVVPPTLEWTDRFWDGVAPMQKDRLFGFLDASGAVVVEPVFMKAQDCFTDALAWVQLP